MNIETVTFCPFGKTCQEVKDNKIQRCAWFIELQQGEEKKESGCAVSWLPILLIENTHTSKGTSAAVESFRNEMVNANNASINLMAMISGLPPLLGNKP